MTHLWQSTIHIDVVLAQKLIETQCHLPVNSIIFLDAGWDNLVYLVNHHLIFRFPHREFGIFCMENELALLPMLAEHVTFPFSKPQWIGQPCTPYPYPFSGYSLIVGKPLCEATAQLIDNKDYALKLADWLQQLHRIPVTKSYADLIKGDQTWRLNVNRRISRCEENLQRYADYFVMAGLNQHLIKDTLDRISIFTFMPEQLCYLHGDLYSRHVIVNSQNLLPTGLIDWGDVHFGPPGIDLAIGMTMTPTVFDAFLNAYGLSDDETLRILLFHSFCHSISFLPYVYEQDNPALKRWAMLVLNRAMAEMKNFS